MKSLLSRLCGSARGDCLKAAQYLHALYRNNRFCDLIDSANGTVIEEHKAKPAPVFDKNNPEDREWLRGWQPDRAYRIVFKAAADNGYEWIYQE